MLFEGIDLFFFPFFASSFSDFIKSKKDIDITHLIMHKSQRAFIKYDLDLRKSQWAFIKYDLDLHKSERAFIKSNLDLHKSQSDLKSPKMNSMHT